MHERKTHVVDLVEGNVARVFDVLLLLAVAWGLLESLDDERGGGGDDGDGRLTVLDGELDGDTETLPVAGRLGDVFSDLLGGLGSVLLWRDSFAIPIHHAQAS